MNKYRTYGRRDEPQVEEGEEKIFGVNQRLDPDKLPAGLCADAQNVRMRKGTPTTRLGTMRPGWLNVTRAGVDAVVKGVSQFYGVGSFKDPNGFEWTLTAAEGGVFRHKPHNGRSALALPMNVRVLSDCSFCQAFNVVYCFRGKYLQPLVMRDVDTGFLDLVARWSASTVYTAAVAATGQVAQEVAYGPFQAVTALTSVGDLATCVTTAEHGYVSGADVTIKGANEAGYNGRWNITVVDVNTFTFQFPGAVSPATGTIKVSNMALYWRALGSQITLGVGELVSAAGVATVNHAAHGFTTGQYVTVTGAAQPEYNVVQALVAVVNANQFTYPIAGAPVSPATPSAGAAIKVRTSVVLAGQSPDTNAEAWQQVFNVLPNCDDGLFVNNRLLAATSYTPGNTSYDSTSTYTKKDFVVALDIGDLVHFDFVNEFRINQGGDDEIVQLIKAPSGAVNASGLSTDAVMVLKGKSWGALTGVSGDLSQVALDMHMDGYGECSLRGGMVAGGNILFPSSVRGICGLVQFAQGQARSVDVPFSNDVAEWIGRIAWQYGAKIRGAYWDDKAYFAVPLDGGVIEIGSATFQNPVNASGGKVEEVVVEVGASYRYVQGNSTGLYTGFALAGSIVPDGTSIGPGVFVATQPTYYIFYPSQVSTTFEVQQVLAGVNNGVLVFDFRTPRIATPGDANSPYVFESGQWSSLDSGQSLCVKEWFKATYNGRERLFFIGEDGWANLMEESDAGDQIQDDASADGLSNAEVVLDWTSRGYKFGSNAQKKYKWLELVLGVWHALFDVWKGLPGQGTTSQITTGKSFSRTKYLKPVGKADYVAGNGNGDFATSGRGDYSVPLSPDLHLPGGGTSGAGGVQLDVFQEVVVRQSVRTLAGRYAQFRVRNRRGRMEIKAVAPTAGEGQRRGGILI